MATQSTLTPAQVAAAMVEHGIVKHRTRYEIMFFKAFIAGVFLSYGGLLSTVLGGGAAGLTATNPGLEKILAGAVFPVGLVMIVLTGQELLTSNMMVFPMALWKRAIPFWSLPLNWLIVLFGNLCGSLFVAGILTKFTGIVSDAPFPAYITAFAIKKAVTPAWFQVFLRGIGCNWLVCIAVWQAAGAKDTLSKIVAIWIPIWIFVACSFDHVVANMFSVPLGIMFHAEGLTIAHYISHSLIPAFLGNVVGGLLVALPFSYFYLQDWNGDQALRGAEEGEVLNEGVLPVAGSSSQSTRSVHEKRDA